MGKDLSSIIDIFKSYDPIHPGQSPSSDPILYLDRLELFMSDVLNREVDIKKEIEEVKLRHFRSNSDSARFLLEYYYQPAFNKNDTNFLGSSSIIFFDNRPISFTIQNTINYISTDHIKTIQNTTFGIKINLTNDKKL